MLSARFEGRVFPASVHVALILPRVYWEEKESGLIMHFDARFEKGSVTVDCEINKFENHDHLIALYNRALDISRTALDLLSFATGRPFTVILEKFTYPVGNTASFGLIEPDMGAECTAYHQGATFNEVFEIMIGEPPVFYALRELIEAISLPRRALVNCARAIDTLRVQMADTASRSRGWGELQNNLQLNESFLKFITERSKGWRHGNYEYVAPAEIKEVTRRAWVVMNRFLEFRKRGNAQLPAADFPVLT